MTNNPFMPNAGAMPMPNTNSAPMQDKFEVDLTEVQNAGYTIPDGTYRVKCTEVEQNVSQSGNPMFVWTFEVVDGDHKGFVSKLFTAITPAAMWKVAEIVIAMGVGQQGEVVKFKRADVVGKECGATFEKTEYNGQERSQIKRIIALSELNK